MGDEQVALVDQPEVLELEDDEELKQSKRKHTESGNYGEEDRLDGIETDKEEMIVEDKEVSARGEDYKEERIGARGEGGGKKKENGVGSDTVMEVTWEGGEDLRDEKEEYKEEYGRSEAGGGEEMEERREMKGVKDNEKEKKENSVPPLWDTVLVQNGDTRGTQV